jgi:hypothetical protein
LALQAGKEATRATAQGGAVMSTKGLTFHREPNGSPLEALVPTVLHLDPKDDGLRKLAGEALARGYGEAGRAVWDAWYAKADTYPGAEAARGEWDAHVASNNMFAESKLINLPQVRGVNRDIPKEFMPEWRAHCAVQDVKWQAKHGPRNSGVISFPVAPRVTARAATNRAEPVAPTAATVAAPPPAKRQPPIDWSSLEGRDPPPRKWTLRHWVPYGNTTLLSGGGGVGKTLLAEHIATAKVLGRPYIEPMSAGTVLFWAGEDDESELWRRQQPICDYFGASLSDLAGKLYLHSYAGADITLMAPVYGQLQPTPMLEDLRRQVADYKPELVILDNIARLFGGNENDRHSVTVFCALVQAACAPAAVLLLGHPAKAAQSEFSGSTAWEGAVRARLFMGYRPPDDKDEGEIDPRVRYLARRKANYGELGLRRFALHDGLLIPETIDPNAPPAAVEALDVVRKVVGQLKDRGLYGATAKQSSNYLPKLAEQNGLLGNVRKRDFEAATVAALNSGLLVVREVGKYANRLPRMGLVLVETPDDGVRQ